MTVSEIAALLNKKGIEVEDNPNTRLSEDALLIVQKRAEEKEASLDAENEDWSVKKAKKKEEPQEVKSMKELLDEKEVEESKIPEDVEHIEPEVPEISGPKVVDKIELPDYIEKEKELREKRKEERRQKAEERKKLKEEREAKRRKRKEKNYLSEEEREKREQKRRERARKRREEKLKEQRRQNYLNRVELKPPTPKKDKKAKVERTVEEQTNTPDKSSQSIFVRLFRWLYYGE